ncbi:hypothetical protein ABKA04_000039 [Annulohypoxylon sp. FPYF3050]
MLGRAVDKKKADAPRASTKTDLSKQLFPSSSPSAHDGNIAQYASAHKWPTKPLSNLGSGSTKATSNNPLQPRSVNPQETRRQYKPISRVTSDSSSAQRSQSLVSLCSNAGSFEDTPDPDRAPSLSKTSVSTYFAEEDFSDDNTLELDMEYRLPESLPPQPVPPKPRKSPSPKPPPTSQTTWSSSPQEHLFPPTNLQKKLKRDSPAEAPRPGPPPAKKRSLPGSWKRDFSSVQKREEDEEVQEIRKLATPAAKKKGDLPWDTSQSAIKEQRKQLKNQNKKSGSGTELTKEEIRAATENHAKQKAKASAISLSTEQQHVIELVIQKKQSVFFTGPAGTGKSVLMRAIIQELKRKWARDPERLSVTASTGLAACNIGGMTLHSFAGIGLGKEDVPTLVKKIRRNAKAKNRWLRTNVLIIDEVSMVDGELFDKLSQIARTIRNNGRPWGGIQLIITGDFFQLPPVPDGGKKEGKFAFEAATWNTSIDHTIGLTQVFRQRDPHFADMLNEMRLGRISEDTIRTFKELSRPLNFDDGLDVTELFPTRQEVERSNDSRLRNLPGAVYHYEANDSGDPNVRDRLLSNMMAPKAMDLKKGAQVMLIKNMDDTLVNGSLGKVVGFMNEATFEIWGARDDEVGSGDEGDADARSKKKIKAFSRDIENMKDNKEYPVVRFSATDGTHRILLCIPEDWKVELPTGEVQASRKQLPLILAWALSIHKAQGQTLERVKVDLGKVFEKGQAYVALSRAVSKEGLQVLRFDKSKVMAHPKVIQFYNKLYSAESAIKPKKQPSTISDFAFKGSAAASSKSKGKAINVIDLDDDEEAMAAYGS